MAHWGPSSFHPGTPCLPSFPLRARTASGETADFGYRTVTKPEKTALLRALFDTVAGRYDLMNELMSLGIDRWWKSAMVDRLDPHPSQPVPDLAVAR